LAHAREDGRVVDFRMQIGRRLRALRTDAGMTQLELQDATGVAASEISKIENGKVDPRVGTLRRIAAGLGVSARDLL
jgi:XRE family transcriptional regulator, fatty acid utilization regulator